MCMNIDWECISCAGNLKEIKCLTAILLAVQWTKAFVTLLLKLVGFSSLKVGTFVAEFS
jgi:hypothetical protein